MMVLSGNSNKHLSRALEKTLTGTIEYVDKTIFPDKEINLNIHCSILNKDIFLLQSTPPPATESIFELLMTLEALKQKGAKSIKVIMSYFGYGRQDQPNASGITPLKSIARLLESAGATEIAVLDPHWHPRHNPFIIPCTPLYSAPLVVDDIKRYGLLGKAVLVAPDQGSAHRLAPLSALLDREILYLDKKRDATGAPHITAPLQDLRGQKCLIIDDIVDSGNTLCETVHFLERQGAQGIRAYVTHGILSPGSHQRLEATSLTELVITDSIPATAQTLAHPKIRQISVAPLLSEYIYFSA